MKKILLLLSIVTVTGVSCRPATDLPPDDPVAVTGVSLNGRTMDLSVGRGATLRATVSPADATNKTVTWKSSNTTVATVNGNGLVTGISDGTATITVTTADGSLEDTCAVTVYAGGTQDLSFGTGGTAVYGDHLYCWSWSAAIQPDGKIVVTGTASDDGNDRLLFIRYNSDGTLDTGFGTGGVAATEELDYGIEPGKTIIQSDGKIVAAGFIGNNVFVTRYNTNGTPDASFGGDGFVETVLPGGRGAIDGVWAVAQAPDGKLVVGGGAFDNGTDYDSTIIRYNVNGTLDTNFGEDGFFIHPVSTESDSLTSVTVRPDGSIMAGGMVDTGSGIHDLLLIRLTPAGVLDDDFNEGGILVIDYSEGDDDRILSLLLEPDGSVIAAGSSGSSSLVLRCDTDGNIDPAFAAGGALIDFATGDSTAVEIARQSDGKIVTGGNASWFSFGIARLTAAGELDASFGTDGITVTAVAIGKSDSYCSGVLLQGGSKIIVVGTRNLEEGAEIVLKRYWQ